MSQRYNPNQPGGRPLLYHHPTYGPGASDSYRQSPPQSPLGSRFSLDRQALAPRSPLPTSYGASVASTRTGNSGANSMTLQRSLSYPPDVSGLSRGPQPPTFLIGNIYHPPDLCASTRKSQDLPDYGENSSPVDIRQLWTTVPYTSLDDLVSLEGLRRHFRRTFSNPSGGHCACPGNCAMPTHLRVVLTTQCDSNATHITHHTATIILTYIEGYPRKSYCSLGEFLQHAVADDAKRDDLLGTCKYMIPDPNTGTIRTCGEFTKKIFWGEHKVREYTYSDDPPDPAESERLRQLFLNTALREARPRRHVRARRTVPDDQEAAATLAEDRPVSPPATATGDFRAGLSSGDDESEVSVVAPSDWESLTDSDDPPGTTTRPPLVIVPWAPDYVTSYMSTIGAPPSPPPQAPTTPPPPARTR